VLLGHSFKSWYWILKFLLNSFVTDQFSSIDAILLTAELKTSEPAHDLSNIKVEVLWVVTLFSDVAGYHRFGEICCLHPLPENGGVTNQNTVT
jgi:hypothetical protein